MKRITPVLFFLILGIALLFPPELALACGGLISRPGSNVQNSQLKAAVIFDPDNGGRERLLIQLNYQVNQGSTRDFGWLMPVPSKPELSAGPVEIFSGLEKATEIKSNYLEQIYDPLFPRVYNRAARGLGGSVSGVQVVTQTRVGVFDISVVSASEPTALQQWAAENDYSSPGLAAGAIEDYLKAGWFFALAKVAPDQVSNGNLNNGIAQPLLLSFNTKEPVYPWRLAAYGPDGKLIPGRSLPVDLFTLQPTTLLEPAPGGTGLELSFAQNLEPAGAAELLKGLPGENNRNFFLGRFKGKVSGEMLNKADLKLKPAPEQAEVGSGNMNFSQWLLAIPGTLFYGEVALLFTTWVLFSSDLVGIIFLLILLGITGAFLIRPFPRRITFVVLAILNFFMGTAIAIIIAAMGTSPANNLVLVSILPLAAILFFTVRWALPKKGLKGI